MHVCIYAGCVLYPMLARGRGIMCACVARQQKALFHSLIIEILFISKPNSKLNEELKRLDSRIAYICLHIVTLISFLPTLPLAFMPCKLHMNRTINSYSSLCQREAEEAAAYGSWYNCNGVSTSLRLRIRVEAAKMTRCRLTLAQSCERTAVFSPASSASSFL